jgi:hypothetical protein
LNGVEAAQSKTDLVADRRRWRTVVQTQVELWNQYKVSQIHEIRENSAKTREIPQKINNFPKNSLFSKQNSEPLNSGTKMVTIFKNNVPELGGLKFRLLNYSNQNNKENYEQFDAHSTLQMMDVCLFMEMAKKGNYSFARRCSKFPLNADATF